MQIELKEENLSRVEEFLRFEDYRNIKVDRLSVEAERGSIWGALLPLSDLKEKPHTIEVSLFEIRYTVDLWYLGYALKDEWALKHEALLLQQYVSGQELPHLPAEELKEKYYFSRSERYVDLITRLAVYAFFGFLILLVLRIFVFLFF